MAKQTTKYEEEDEKYKNSQGFGSMISSFFGSLFSSVKENIKQGASDILDNLQLRVLNLQRKLLRHLFIVICIGAAVAFLLLSLCFYLTDVLQWPRYAVFLALGVILLCIASIRANLRD